MPAVHRTSEQDIAIVGAGAVGIYLASLYPMPALPGFKQGRLLTRGFEAQGLKVSAASTAVNSVLRNGRPACLYDGWCDAGCPTGALANPLVLHYQRALAAGVVFHTDCTVQQLVAGRDGKLTALQYRDAQGVARSARAQLFVLAGSTVQNARLLLHSGTSLQSQGLANSSGLVGRYFNCHSLVTTYGIMDEPTDNHLGLSAGQHICFSEYPKQRKDGPFGSYFLGFGAALKPNDLLGIANTRPDVFGAKLHRFMRDEGRRLTTITAECENLPSAENRIALDSAQDATGYRLAVVNHSIDDNGLALWQHARHTAEACMRAAGAGLFPSGGAVGPTYTIYALTLRAAQHTLANWPSITASAR